MTELVLASFEKNVGTLNSGRCRSIGAWFHFLNVITVGVICLVFLKLYRGLAIIYAWLFPMREIVENPTILVIGPETDIIRCVISLLAKKFRSHLVDIGKDDYESSIKPTTEKRSTLLYTHAPIEGSSKIRDISQFVESTYGRVDMLVIAQNEDRIGHNSTQTFLNRLNRELLQQFWTVMAFLPGMLRRNSGDIVSIELRQTPLINTGVIRTIYEELQQSDTKVKFTLMERNTFLECFLPRLSTDIIARMIVGSMWNTNSIVKIPSLSSCFFILPTSIIRALARSFSKLGNLALA